MSLFAGGLRIIRWEVEMGNARDVVAMFLTSGWAPSAAWWPAAPRNVKIGAGLGDALSWCAGAIQGGDLCVSILVAGWRSSGGRRVGSCRPGDPTAGTVRLIMRNTIVLTLMSVVLLTAAPALAQDEASPTPYTQVLSTNPFFLLANMVNGEYERKVSPATSVSVSGWLLGSSGNGDVALAARWYARGAALEGFYLGARTAIVRYEEYRRGPRTYPGVGFELGATRLFGPKQNVSVSAGFGLTRLIGAPADFSVWPSVRLINLGVAF